MIQDKSPSVTLVNKEKFTFCCNDTVPCFTNCCRSVYMQLYPYDVIRLKKRLGMTSEAFLLKHTIVSFNENPCFPNVTLKMSDARGHPCTFVTEKGCAIYKDRPYTCRAYPLELAMYGDAGSGYWITGRVIPQPHCKGHGRGREWALSEWVGDQDMETYNVHNSAWSEMMNFLYAPDTFSGGQDGHHAMGLAYMASYNLDMFRLHVLDTDFRDRYEVSEKRLRAVKTDDVSLMYLGFDWIYRFLGGRGPLKEKTLVSRPFDGRALEASPVNYAPPKIVSVIPVEPAHKPFLFDLYCMRRSEDLPLALMPPDEVDRLMDMQFRAYERHHKSAYDETEDCIILYDGQPAGRVILGLPADELVLADICLLPEYRGKGIAGIVIRDLRQRAANRGAPLTLSVHKGSPAIAVYEKLGFRKTGEDEMMLSMAWVPEHLQL